MKSPSLRMEKAVAMKIPRICSTFLWNSLLLVSQRWGKHFLPEMLELSLEAFSSYYYSRNIVQKKNYCMEKMTCLS